MKTTLRVWVLTSALLAAGPSVAATIASSLQTASPQQNCGGLTQAAALAQAQSGAVTQSAMSSFFAPQPSVSIEGCLKNLMNQTVGLGLYGLDISTILTQLENEACSAAQGAVSNVTAQGAQNLNIPGATIGGPGSPFYVPGAGGNVNVNQSYQGAPAATLNGGTVNHTPSSWLQNLMQ